MSGFFFWLTHTCDQPPKTKHSETQLDCVLSNFVNNKSWVGPGNKAVVLLILCIKSGHEPFSKVKSTHSFWHAGPMEDFVFININKRISAEVRKHNMKQMFDYNVMHDVLNTHIRQRCKRNWNPQSPYHYSFCSLVPRLPPSFPSLALLKSGRQLGIFLRWVTSG